MSQSIRAGELSNVGLSIVLRTKCVKVKKIFGEKPTLLVLMYSKGTFFNFDSVASSCVENPSS